LESVVADAVALPFKEGCFSLVVSTDVLEHIAEDDVALSEMRRVVKLGGKLLLHTPNKKQTHIVAFKGSVKVSDGHGGTRVMRFGEEQEDHKRVGYTFDELHEKLKNAGFKTTTVERTFNILEALAWEWDRLCVYECMHEGKDPARTEMLQLRASSMANAMRQMLTFDIENFKNLGWLAEAE
jgi:ubiquinone/menaquinone biosynthesis C-methylase UbiE